MNTITTKDGTQIYYKDWGLGQPVVFSHGWPLSSDSWEAQMLFLASSGYRCIAHDRRGHARSECAAHRARNHQLFVRANDANRGPAGVRGTRLPRSPHCETHSAFEAGS
jgi:pimeloyl-ACP methyl ester carboxylesterase